MIAGTLTPGLSLTEWTVGQPALPPAAKPARRDFSVSLLASTQPAEPAPIMM